MSRAEESTSASIDATTLWVLSDGVTTTDQRLSTGTSELRGFTHKDPTANEGSSSKQGKNRQVTTGEMSTSAPRQQFVDSGTSQTLTVGQRRAMFRQQLTGCVMFDIIENFTKLPSVAGERLAPCAEYVATTPNNGVSIGRQLHSLMYAGGKRASLGCEIELRRAQNEAFDDRHGAYFVELQCIVQVHTYRSF